MRKILFRGKQVDNGEWFEGDLVTYPSGTCKIVITTSKQPIFGTLKEVIPETVGQYTGLTDKNGEKIFEGDIVIKRTCRGKENCVVKFEGGMFNCGYGGGSSTPAHRYTLEDKQIKIIGNIHDTPELLGASDD